MRKVAVFFGGKSCENEISILTGLFVLKLLDREKFSPIPVYIHTDGGMYTSPKMSDLNFFKENRKEEWQRMSTSQRNQLALDRWKKGSKSNWTIGMLYEMYAAYCLRVNQKASWSQFEIIPFGINEGRADLGRDLIVKYNPTLFDDNKFTMGNPEPITWVMQCKRWKKERVIRENVICQLYGTTIEYKLKNNPKEKVVPMLVTTTDLSDMAKRFAEALGVVVKVLPYEDFPMIKCNINNGQKIYHLPFDQQYWRTNIDRPGEFYAMTVEEAEKAGFRRAFKHFVGKA